MNKLIEVVKDAAHGAVDTLAALASTVVNAALSVVDGVVRALRG